MLDSAGVPEPCFRRHPRNQASQGNVTGQDMTEELATSGLGAIQSMRDALRWAAEQSPPARFVDAVAQDEFTHDVIVKVADDYYLVFDTT